MLDPDKISYLHVLLFSVALISLYWKVQEETGKSVARCSQSIAAFLEKCLERAGVNQREALDTFERHAAAGGIVLVPRMRSRRWWRCIAVKWCHFLYRLALAAQGVAVLGGLGLEQLDSSTASITLTIWTCANLVLLLGVLMIAVRNSPKVVGLGVFKWVWSVGGQKPPDNGSTSEEG